jgi:hypothetical protein
MSQGGFNAIALVFNCTNTKWEPFHVRIGIFEVHETLRVATTMQLKESFIHFGLCDKVITYMKD